MIENREFMDYQSAGILTIINDVEIWMFFNYDGTNDHNFLVYDNYSWYDVF